MSLAAIASPSSESELAVMLCTLEVHGIPAFVQGGHFGALYPGPQIAFYNARRVMVPCAYAAEAREALAIFTQPLEPAISRQPSILDKLRIILECVFFGWFVPGNRSRAAPASGSSLGRTRKRPDAA